MHELTGNYGLQDMILALKWVESNIGAFGGNAKNVTIWGESAGAHAVGLLLSSQQSRGLYSGALLESGAFWDYEYGSIQTFSEARALGAELQNALGANSTAQLRQESPETIDCYVLSLPPAEVFSKGLQPNVPMLAGINAREDLIFAAESFPYDTPQHFRDAAALWFWSAVPFQLFVYLSERHTHFVFRTLTPSPFAPDTPPSPSDEAFSEQLQTYRTNFAKYGTPNHAGDGLARWPSYAGGARNVQQLTSPIAPTMYNITGFEFLKGFRTAGLFPTQWHSLNVSSVTN